MLESVLDIPNLFIFAKDKNLKFLFCNENFAQVAGLDSPKQIVGKSDYDLYWKTQADYFRNGDYEVLAGHPRVNIPEIQMQPGKIASLLVTKTKFLNKTQQCVGVIGNFIDVTGYTLTRKSGFFEPEKKRLNLNEIFNNEYLTPRELQVFKYILCGYTSGKIAILLRISPKTVEYYTQIIKRKLQCTSKGDIIATAVRYGLTFILFENNF